ncbi:MAG: hypothetical protein WD266_07985 [Balneolales bacterium]
MPYFPRLLSGLLILAFTGIAPAHAQFEGTLEINRYSVTQSGEQNLENSYKLSLSPDHILLSGAENAKTLDLMGAIDAHSIIIRQQKEDFVFLGNRSEAVVLKKQELLSMVKLMENMQGMNQGGQAQQKEEMDREFEPTSERRRINDYQAQKWIMRSKESSEVYHVWLTEELAINWGMLSESWLTDLTLFSDLPFTEWVGDGKTPVLVERFVNGQLSDKISLEAVRKRNLSENHFNIPAGTEMVNFQQLLLKRMSGR